MEASEQLGTNMRRIRKERGLTQEQIALDCGLSLTYVNKIESGKRNPSLDVIARLAGALPCRVAALVEGVKAKPPQ